MNLQRRLLLQKLLAAVALARLAPQVWSANNPIHCAYGEDYAPWSIGERNKVQGLAPDLITALLTNTLQQELTHNGYPWKRAQYLIQQGDADLMCSAITPARLEYVQASNLPIFSTSTGFYFSKNSAKLTAMLSASSAEELFALNPSAVSYLGSGWFDRLRIFKKHEGTNLVACLKILAAGRVDLMIDNRMVMQHSIAELKLDALITESRIETDPVHFHILLSKKSSFLPLLPLIDAAMPNFKKSEDYKNIIKTYLPNWKPA